MPYENNHYIPRLVLRRYGDRINSYNLKTKELNINKNIYNCFSEKNLYPEDIEKKLCDVESRFANLLNNKILKAEKEVILYRHEISLIKKFLVLQMFRVPDALVEHPEEKENESFKETLYQFKEKKIPGETYKEYIFRTIRVIIESNSFEEIINHPDKTYEDAKWFLLMQSCYLTIWDSASSNEDFLITDRGMTCEHEKTRFMFENLGFKEELIKEGYILSNLSSNDLTEKQKKLYSDIMFRMRFVYANYYMFSISETRMIGLVNPWYRLCFDKNRIEIAGKKPDVYPCMLSETAMEPNKNRYVNQKDEPLRFDAVIEPNDNDEYIYEIKNISFEDVCIINCMMLDRAYELIGFVDSRKIIRSLNVYNKLKVKLNDYKNLQMQLEDMGYNFSNKKIYDDLSFKITHIEFTPAEWKYINFISGFKNKIKNGKL